MKTSNLSGFRLVNRQPFKPDTPVRVCDLNSVAAPVRGSKRCKPQGERRGSLNIALSKEVCPITPPRVMLIGVTQIPSKMPEKHAAQNDD